MPRPVSQRPQWCAEPQASITTRLTARLANQRSNRPRERWWRSITRQCASATASSRTFFAKSTVTVVAFISDSLRLVALTPTPHEASWRDDAENELGGVHPIIHADTASRRGLTQVLCRTTVESSVVRRYTPWYLRFK
jgi:hypothetical protein